MRLALLFTWLIIFQNVSAQPDSTSGTWNIIARADYGFVIAHRPALEPLQERHVKGFELTWSRQYPGTEYWHSTFNFPEYGITVAGFDLGTDKLGTGIAVYPFIDFPLGKKGFRNFHFRYGMGLGYIENTFDPIDNIKNAALGSKINGVIHLDLHYSKEFFKNTFIEAGPALTHFSNGSYSLPNLGLNVATFNLGFQHSFGKNIPIRRPEKPVTDLTSQIHVYTGGFFKKVYPPQGESFFAMTLSGLWFKPVNFKSAFGAGADVFYDNSISARIKAYGEEIPESINNYRFGIYGSYQLSAGHLALILNMGCYLYNAWDFDGNIYHRLGLRYYFEKIFLCMNLKTHYARADYIELGGGIRFKKKKQK